MTEIKSIGGHSLYVSDSATDICTALVEAQKIGADLDGANLRETKNADLAIARTRILPDGHIIGWKKCRGSVIVKLEVPADARRSHGAGRTCRAEFARVSAIYDTDGNPVQTAASVHDVNFLYHIGEIVTPTQPFDTDQWVECGSGVHFYITREEAEALPVTQDDFEADADHLADLANQVYAALGWAALSPDEVRAIVDAVYRECPAHTEQLRAYAARHGKQVA